MNKLLKTVYFFVSISLSLIYSRDMINKNQSLLSHSNFNSNDVIFHKYKQLRRSESNSMIWQEDFENDAENWLIGDGWELTDDRYHSTSHSIFSPDNNSNMDGYFMLYSPKISIPEIKLNEWIYFTFWLYADIPDYNSDDDDNIDDYYQLDIQASTENPAWHISDYKSFSDNSYWCGTESDEGYHDSWLQFLDTPSIQIPSGGYSLEVQMKWAIEDTLGAANADVSEGWIDGWDAINVRISVDGGLTWELLIGDDPPSTEIRTFIASHPSIQPSDTSALAAPNVSSIAHFI
jgi:hypothetical protein